MARRRALGPHRGKVRPALAEIVHRRAKLAPAPHLKQDRSTERRGHSSQLAVCDTALAAKTIPHRTDALPIHFNVISESRIACEYGPDRHSRDDPFARTWRPLQKL